MAMALPTTKTAALKGQHQQKQTWQQGGNDGVRKKTRGSKNCNGNSSRKQ